MAPDRRTVLQLTGGAVAGILAGCAGGGGGTSVEATTDVAMVNSQFDPRNVHVGAGATVTWANEDGDAHTVTSASDNWVVDVEVPGGETATHTFDSDGVYDVYCRFHGSSDLSGMSMKVGVGEATIEQPLGSGGGDVGGGY
ncbi:plastocyanin/azurin family copper-binding protein [Halomicroarcula sp. S1AR25-4]|uniref:cupredoxin domain-containing protein n=1 Tax=Haloarcula sp. S1AR25-4 TaxID=2950538 RepID=UPI002875D873|nr:plastocyanin/azurin family copper-binding protein [Halomicroarcula sp. S1AR25-4]MDS0278498.1 plastocyanin/azurin family copper-binding protein [Halomicroarcula sp. S1AR25-4]